MVKNLPTMQEAWILSLGWGDPLENGIATHYGILACRIPWTEEPSGLNSMGCKELDATEWQTHFSLSLEDFGSRTFLTQNNSLSHLSSHSFLLGVRVSLDQKTPEIFRSFPGSSVSQKSTCSPGDQGSIPLGWEDPLKQGMANHSSILAWKIPWTEEPGVLWSIGHKSRTWLNSPPFRIF